ncbi:AbrB/MazE/SpoVT family DNA-binding domain-containing protein [Pelotomaculum terephthalicicum JT]|uniref:AbrB/MazE/SpoVT family DNA-binding domain-containing protein n=1 Tax=Pelotomaculum TaxID=191373 RepID=UPI0009D4DCDE|nr:MULTISPECIES: AbrB/MazE/SpoVT family DNA-binding domain-containing protein [Pelotomaculum]MCG9969174.1 AbrB/MazE/SpoVT family DNA-binding domain-containing protein [Pelotomaculum terephthalicicum JT]OPX87716.1 MAG: putative regulator PrlF [Pelotomaculum sp. PtaB.Bin117]OPY61617.1 MAG: putative regulator PrlF [Pelotomaculum sp. PtaU1.Bin065]
MDIAKITNGGQITIPINIRKKLGLKDGDKVIFIEDGGKHYICQCSQSSFFEYAKGV